MTPYSSKQHSMRQLRICIDLKTISKHFPMTQICNRGFILSVCLNYLRVVADRKPLFSSESLIALTVLI